MLKGYCLRKDNKMKFCFTWQISTWWKFFSIYMNIGGLPKFNSSTLKKNKIILSYILVICNLGQYFVFNWMHNFKRVAMIALIIDIIDIINWVSPNYVKYIVNTSLFFMEFAQGKMAVCASFVPDHSAVTMCKERTTGSISTLSQLYIASSQSDDPHQHFLLQIGQVYTP